MSKTYFKNYKSATDFLMLGLAKSGGKVFRGEEGLAKTKRFLQLIDNPQQDLRAIHIAGTSGKGTVAYMIDSILRQHGFTTGLLMSPHVYDLRERFQINGSLISRADFVGQLNLLMPAIIDRFLAAESPTYFQVNTALGFSLLKRRKVDYAVIETGLGGLYDSTNALERTDKLCVITRIGKDHQRILGRAYRTIAAQKAGIIHDGNYVITIRQRPDVNRAITDWVQTKKAEVLLESPENYRKFQINNQQLSADFQFENIALAFAACRKLAQRDGWIFSEDNAIQALNELALPGRFDVVNRNNQLFIFDGAHNPQKLAALASQYQSNYEGKATLIMALKSDKHARDSLAAISPIAKKFIFTNFLVTQDFAAKSHAPKKLLALSKHLGVEAEVANSAQEALALAAKDRRVLVTGSNYLLGDIRQLLDD